MNADIYPPARKAHRGSQMKNVVGKEVFAGEKPPG